ncbi:hypothetical protein BDZ89DRAFT_1073714 [Hymenopellis radicata]|nr:hypothetical protein BDZ89DRAFT_1073714 [Hymenopellis radicata]
MPIPTAAPCTRCGFNPSSDTVDSSWNVLDVLRSGHIPPSVASSCIPDRVGALKTRQGLLYTDITRLECLILQKRKEIAATEIEIWRAESLAAPIRSIPPEILLLIFSLVHEATPPPHGLIFLFKLGHVCKYWRTLSRASPSLWSSINLVEKDEELATDGIEEQLVLSSPRPLTVRISSHSHFDPCPNTGRLLGALSGHMARCRSLDMTVTRSSLLSFLSVLHRAHLGILESLTVTCHGRLKDHGPELKSLNLFFHPSLHSLDMTLPLDYFKAVKIHWPSLTSFAGPFSNSGTFLQFLTSARQLVKLDITCIGSHDRVDGKPLVHENLRRLTLDSSCSMSPALEKISLPHLDDLIVQQSDEYHVTCKTNSPTDDSLLFGLVERSQCKLKTFTLDDDHEDIPPEKITSILRLSSITSFRVLLGMTFHLFDKTSTFLDLLTVTDSQIFLPSLRELDLWFCTTTDGLFINERLPTMVRSRWDVQSDVARLSKLTFSMEESLEPHPACSTSMLALLLLDLEDKGLEVSWTVESEDVLKEGREHRQRFL